MGSSGSGSAASAGEADGMGEPVAARAAVDGDVAEGPAAGVSERGGMDPEQVAASRDAATHQANPLRLTATIVTAGLASLT